jgi:hypothetical protein
MELDCRCACRPRGHHTGQDCAAQHTSMAGGRCEVLPFWDSSRRRSGCRARLAASRAAFKRIQSFFPARHTRRLAGAPHTPRAHTHTRVAGAGRTERTERTPKQAGARSRISSPPPPQMDASALPHSSSRPFLLFLWVSPVHLLPFVGLATYGQQTRFVIPEHSSRFHLPTHF